MITPRARVIENAVQIERFVTSILSFLLDINLTTSKTLGHRSGSLSFIQKINMLTDTETMSTSLRQKFEHFAQIRNQFAHNYQVSNFSSCFEHISGLEKSLKKLYPNVSENKRQKSF